MAHLPWRAFGYKAFNTFIDDVFAFIIKMPTSHRIACLRDDVVFFCYLYQVILILIFVQKIINFLNSAISTQSTRAASTSSASRPTTRTSNRPPVTLAARVTRRRTSLFTRRSPPLQLIRRPNEEIILVDLIIMCNLQFTTSRATFQRFSEKNTKSSYSTFF